MMSVIDFASHRAKDLPTLIRIAMRQKGVSKQALLENGIIRKCTCRSFNQRLDEGTLFIWELEGLLDFLGIERIGAVLAVHGLNKPEQYFEPTCQAASYMAKGMVIALTEKMDAVEGNFNPMLESVCQVIADRQADGLIQRNQAINDMRFRDFG